MVCGSGAEGCYRGSDDDLEEHGDRDYGVADRVPDVRPALAGADFEVDSSVVVGALGGCGFLGGLFAAEDISGGFGWFGGGNAERTVEDCEGVVGLDFYCHMLLTFFVRRCVTSAGLAGGGVWRAVGWFLAFGSR